MQADQSGQVPLVLLAEDHEDNREMYEHFLTLSGFRFVGVRDGAEAVNQAIERHPAVIVLDLGMPRMGGWDACKYLKNNIRTQSIPIVALTGYAGKGAEAEAAGCDLYLIKPCSPEKLVEAIRTLLAARS